MPFPRRGYALAVVATMLAVQAQAQVQLPEINVTAPTQTPDDAAGTLPVVTDQFSSVTVVPSDEIRRNGGSTLGDLLLSKPGITGSSFAPGASSRPIIRGLDGNRVRIQENGVGANGASDLGEDHFVPVDPLATDNVEVIRGPATLRYGSQAIGGVVETSNNRIPSALPQRPLVTEFRGNASSVDTGANGAVLLDAGGGNFAVHADAFGRTANDYRVPHYPYLTPPGPAAPNATQPGAFNGKQPNSSLRSTGESLGGSYVFDGGYFGLAAVQTNSLYHIPGIDGENSNTRIDAQQTKVLTKGEFRAPWSGVDALRFWGGATDYRHNELGLADPTNFGSDGIRQIFTNKEQEGRIEAQLTPFNLRFADVTTILGTQFGHQTMTAPSPDNAGLWDPNENSRIAGYLFNEFRLSPQTRAQIAGRIETTHLSGTGRTFDALGAMTSTPAALNFAPKSASIGLLQDLPLNLVASITAQYVERAPRPAELFSGGGHDATGTFDKGNTNLGIESARTVEAGLRRAAGPFRFELTAYYTRFDGFIFRRLTGQMCDDTGVCGAAGDLREAIYSQADATFRGAEWQSQFDIAPLHGGWVGIDNQFDVVRATFTDGTNVPRIPPMRIGGGIYWRDPQWLARVNLLHAFAQNDIALTGETPTAGYNDLRFELSYRTTIANPRPGEPAEFRAGISGSNLLNADIRNHVSYSKDEVLMPGASVRLFAAVKY
ncbi:MAG: TonB-dependent receptor [Pseudolabrys sp.]|nr:TonB-dependent receptor [Pseudolabrys sp.]